MTRDDWTALADAEEAACVAIEKMRPDNDNSTIELIINMQLIACRTREKFFRMKANGQ